MYAYLVGTEDRWEFLVAGDPLRQIGIAEPEAKQGEVIKPLVSNNRSYLLTKLPFHTPHVRMGESTWACKWQ